MKINILVSLKEGPYGGGNQFLKSLRKNLKKKRLYTENPYHSDILLFNSFPFGDEIRFLQAYKLKKRNKLIFHRIDGPIFKTRNTDYEVDKIIYFFYKHFVDGLIFQSNWSKTQNLKLGLKLKENYAVIMNAPDPVIFNKRNRMEFDKNRKTRLISTSWASNWMKGFKFYRYLDENLDFSRYSMMFIGNSPIKFRNINHIKPLNSKELAEKLKQNDIFLIASRNDPCSNSLIEAIHCGLPAVAYYDAGHPEIIGSAGEIFRDKNDLIEKIDRVKENYFMYQNNINCLNIDEITEKYVQFIKDLYERFKNGVYKPKKVNIFSLFWIYFLIFLWKVKKKQFRNILNVFMKNVRKRN